MAPVDPDAPAREMYKATFANGVEYYLDRHQHAIPTHFGDSKGVQHPLVSIERASDDEEVRFVDPYGEPADGAVPAGQGSFRPEDSDAEIAALEARLAELRTGKTADFVPSG